MTAPRPSRARRVLLGLALSLLHREPSRAQRFDEEQVKAAYVYNFAKFAEWPATAFTAANDPIRMCVLNDQPFQSQLMHIIKDKRIGDRVILAVSIQNPEQARHCHLLFINSTHNVEVIRLFASLQGSSVLTVGETASFVDRGGIISFVTQEGQVHFQVNHKAATESGIRLSSRLLSVARRVIE